MYHRDLSMFLNGLAANLVRFTNSWTKYRFTVPADFGQREGLPIQLD